MTIEYQRNIGEKAGLGSLRVIGWLMVALGVLWALGVLSVGERCGSACRGLGHRAARRTGAFSVRASFGCGGAERLGVCPTSGDVEFRRGSVVLLCGFQCCDRLDSHGRRQSQT